MNEEISCVMSREEVEQCNQEYERWLDEHSEYLDHLDELFEQDRNAH